MVYYKVYIDFLYITIFAVDNPYFIKRVEDNLLYINLKRIGKNGRELNNSVINGPLWNSYENSITLTQYYNLPLVVSKFFYDYKTLEIILLFY